MSNREDNNASRGLAAATGSAVWKELDWGMCDGCGSSPAAALTNADDGYVYDGDEIRCPECGAKGSASADGGDAWINWDEDTFPDADELNAELSHE